MVVMKNSLPVVVSLLLIAFVAACQTPQNPSGIFPVVIGADNVVRVEGRKCPPEDVPQRLRKIGWTKDSEVLILCWGETDAAVISAVSNAVITAGYPGVDVVVK